MISPCVNILRALANQINATLGSKQGTKHHNPDITVDITELMKSMRRYHVYEKTVGRTIDSSNPIVPDLLTVGLHELFKPLQEYNNLFHQLQQRRERTPLITTDGGWKPSKRKESNNTDVAENLESANDVNSAAIDLTAGESETESVLADLSQGF